MAKRGHGEGTIRQRSDERWEARAWGLDDRGRRVRQSVYGATQGDVQKLLRQRAADNELRIRSVLGTVSVKQYLTTWLNENAKLRLSKRTYRQYEQAVTRHISPGLGHLRLRELTAADIQRWVSKKAEKLAPKTVRGLFAVLRVALRDACKMDVLPKDPTRAVALPKLQQRTRTFLSPDEARRFLLACRGTRLGNLFELALTLGLRIGEVLALQWSAVNLGDRSVLIHRTVHRTKAEGFTFGEPKSKASRRTLDLPAMTVKSLERQFAAQVEARLAAKDSWTDWGLVFTTPVGTPLDHSNVTKEFKRMLKAASLPDIRHPRR